MDEFCKEFDKEVDKKSLMSSYDKHCANAYLWEWAIETNKAWTPIHASQALQKPTKPDINHAYA